MPALDPKDYPFPKPIVEKDELEALGRIEDVLPLDQQIKYANDENYRARADTAALYNLLRDRLNALIMAIGARLRQGDNEATL